MRANRQTDKNGQTNRLDNDRHADHNTMQACQERSSYQHYAGVKLYFVVDCDGVKVF